MNRSDKAALFASLHKPGDPVILYNAWDPGSAKIIADAGAKAIATGSFSVAGAFGFEDREALPIDLALANAERIVAAVDLPVTIDFEGAYATDPDQAGRNVGRLAATGAIGCNVEDQAIGGEGLHPIPLQADRIRAIRAAVGPEFFINARTDIFLKAPRETHNAAMVDEALERGRAYADAGASGLFLPGLIDEGLIERACRASPLPVNIMNMIGAPSAARLAELGVARISHAGGPWRLAMRALKEAAETVYRA
ncbi:MAG TPA: isocitrate lyase/phosphoenolpyruvate mutase family protein [Allosphingosinicella sp.]|jgi:2-methylisocitrate lyase-like PEP mutase family enzyme|nr:isocitrate lyase/phosphoenolpyruvate mutase family protein [Allosphingosinicella sp.]